MLRTPHVTLVTTRGTTSIFRTDRNTAPPTAHAAAADGASHASSSAATMPAKIRPVSRFSDPPCFSRPFFSRATAASAGGAAVMAGSLTPARPPRPARRPAPNHRSAPAHQSVLETTSPPSRVATARQTAASTDSATNRPDPSISRLCTPPGW